MARTDLWDRFSQRALPVWLPVAAVVLIVARVISSRYEVKSPVDLVRWVLPRAAEQMARAAHKPILYEFGAEWCGPCHVMEEEVFRDAELAKMINDKFVPVKLVDTRRETGKNLPEVATLESRFGVRAFPTVVVVLQAEGAPRTMVGYPGKAEFETFLRGIP